MSGVLHYSGHALGTHGSNGRLVWEQSTFRVIRITSCVGNWNVLRLTVACGGKNHIHRALVTFGEPRVAEALSTINTEHSDTLL